MTLPLAPADGLLAQLCEHADPRKVRSLELVHHICLEQKDRGSQDFSIATIGRLCSARKGPGARAMRNKSGEAYRTLIARHSEGIRRDKRVVSSSADDLLEGLRDPTLRARVGMLQAELKATRVQLAAARHLATQHAVVNLGTTMADSDLPVVVSSKGLGVELSASERSAITSALNPQQLADWGWSIDERGRVLSESGRTIFPIGFATALAKVVLALDGRTGM